ncbi:MAG: single-stranded DNA-binding protein [Candidatus Nanopelagicaceae bacterium]
MPSYNKIIVMGNLTRDPVLKNLAAGSVVEIGVAVNRQYQTKSGEEREETTFFDCECWGSMAETISKHFNKGRPIFIEGRMKQDTWEDKDGQKRSKMRVVIEGFQFVDSKPSSQTSQKNVLEEIETPF